MDHIDYFTVGITYAKSVHGFLQSYIGRYLEKIYGPLTYTETIGSTHVPVNFIEVFRIPGVSEFAIMDTSFFDSNAAIEEHRIGYIFPDKYKDLEFFHRDQPQKHNQTAINLCKLGYAPIWVPNDETMLYKLRKQKWAQLPKNIFDSSQNFDVVEDYMADQKTTLSFLGASNYMFQRVLGNVFENNKLVEACIPNTISRAQRMTNGSNLIPHFDADAGEPYLFSGLSWHTDSKDFTGRELVCGRRSPGDLARFITRYLDDPYFESYNSKIEELEDLVSFKPKSDVNLLVNTANPLYYHAVTEMKGDGEIYTIVHDCRMHND